MLTAEYLNKLLENIYPYNIREDVINRLLTNCPLLGTTWYVVAQYHRWEDFQYFPVTITSTRLGAHDKKTFSVEGYYSKTNHRYQGNFSINSIGKSVFSSEKDAQLNCEARNLKLRSTKKA